jgi:long-chain acyl-CoA synthetase
MMTVTTALKPKWWLEHYPLGVAHDIDLSRYTSLPAMAEECFDKFRDRAAYTCMDKTLTYGEVDTLSQALGAWLQSKGLRKGGRVALMMPNVLQYPVAILAVLRAGYVVVNVNPLYTPRELEHQLNDSGAEVIVILENFATTLEAVLPKTKIKHVVLASVGDLLGFPKGLITNFVVRKVKKLVPQFSLHGSVKFNDAISEGRSLKLVKPNLGPDDIAFLQYTGGTTGVSKGAVLVHANIFGACLSGEAWVKPAMDDQSKGPALDQSGLVCALPMYHIFCLVTCMWLAIKLGGHCILIPNPRDLDGMIKVLRKHKFSVLPAVNTMFNSFVNHPDFATLDFSQLRVSNGGGMAVQRAVTCNEVMNADFNGDVGMPMPGVEISIRDDTELEIALGQPGEICIRGPQVMHGYWQRPDETAKVMTKDGFFKSGDIGIMLPNGHIKIVDRKKDMILVSGFNVFPNEIEDVIASMPGVMECAVVGIPDEKTGEAVKLFIVKKDPALTETAVMEYCRKNLTGYKCPKKIVFRESLPKSNVGKILRRELRDK